MQIMSSIPYALRGRGHKQCVPIKCDCGEEFLAEHRRGPLVRCPKCKLDASFEEDAMFNQTHNGQER